MALLWENLSTQLDNVRSSATVQVATSLESDSEEAALQLEATEAKTDLGDDSGAESEGQPSEEPTGKDVLQTDSVAAEVEVEPDQIGEES